MRKKTRQNKTLCWLIQTCLLARFSHICSPSLLHEVHIPKHGMYSSSWTHRSLLYLPPTLPPSSQTCTAQDMLVFPSPFLAFLPSQTILFSKHSPSPLLAWRMSGYTFLFNSVITFSRTSFLTFAGRVKHFLIGMF